MTGLFDIAYAAKAWVGALVFAVTQLVAAAQLAIADEAISLAEAEGLWLLVTEVVGVVVLVRQVFKARNKPAPSDGSIHVGGG